MERPRAIGGVPLWGLALVAVVAATAWAAGGLLVQRRLAARVPALDVEGLPPALAAPIAQADAAARRAPSADAIGALGSAYHATQRPAPAIAAYALAEALAPGEWRWTYLQGLLLEERGDAPGARAAFEQVVAEAPSSGLAWFRLAEIAFKEGRVDDASAAYEHARDAPAEAPFLPPGVTARQTTALNAYARLGLARVALERRQVDVAGQALRALVEAYPAFGPARGLLRAVDRDRGALPDTAAPNAVEGPYVPPADPRLDAIVASSRHADLLLKHAGLATRAGDSAWREFLARRAFASDPRDLNVLMEMSAMLQSQRRHAEALEYLQKHEALAPGDHHTLVQQGRLLADLGRVGEAEAVLRRAVLVRDTTAEFNLGAVLDQQDRWEDARAHYERALAIDPFNTSAMNNLAVGLDRHGQTAAALGMFERAIAIAPDTAEYYVNYGSALIQHRRLDDAVRALAVAIRLDPRAANAHNNLGIAFAQRQMLPQARQAFERALQLDPAHANAKRNLELTLQVLKTGRP
jgi:tetratricopeptide (TPR) repeat protein